VGIALEEAQTGVALDGSPDHLAGEVHADADGRLQRRQQVAPAAA
jgi:hypothetical protein